MNQHLLNTLLQPRAYPEPTRSVRLIQTHVSFLFITDSFVYKVKKPVDFGFLNFTTLDRRRFYCEEEVRLNRRLCPDIYLGVAELRETADGAVFDGNGPVIDYAVKMKRLPEERMLDRLLAENGTTEEEMRLVARKIAAFHTVAERSTAIDEFGTVTAIERNWRENFEQLAPFCGVTTTGKDLRIIRSWVEDFLQSNADLFSRRIVEGFIRDCDGDIHTGNICLTDDVCIFDCIEFNSRFRYSDTAADLAFLLMDLDFRDCRSYGEAVLEEYLQETGDRDMRFLLDFYKAYRAVVRGKVESFRLNDPDIGEKEKAEARARADRYLRLARGYAVRGRLPLSLIITCGLMGSGKSSVASALSFELGIDVISSDRVRKESAGIAATAPAAASYGEGLYSAAADEETYALLLDRSEEALAKNRSIVVDATFRRKKDRLAFRSAAARLGARFLLLFMACPEDVAQQRLQARAGHQGEISDGRWELYHQQRTDFEDPVPHEEDFIFIATSRPISDTIETILAGMGVL